MDTDPAVATHAPLGPASANSGCRDSSRFSVQAVKRLTSCQSCGQVPVSSELTLCSVSFHSEIELWQGFACQTLMWSVLTNDLAGVWYIQGTRHVGNVSWISQKNTIVHHILSLQVGLTECSMIIFWWPLCNNCPHNLWRVKGRGGGRGCSGGCEL